jgi:hypothetical protein
MLTCRHKNGCDLSWGYGVTVQRDDAQHVVGNTESDRASPAAPNVCHTKPVPLAWRHCESGQRSMQVCWSVQLLQQKGTHQVFTVVYWHLCRDNGNILRKQWFFVFETEIRDRLSWLRLTWLSSFTPNICWDNISRYSMIGSCHIFHNSHNHSTIQSYIM